jgi:heat shock protein HtpX
MKRIVLFLLTNIAVMLVLSIVTSVLGLDQVLAANGLDLTRLLAFSAVFGFGGAIISLLMSKSMAKWSTGAHVPEVAVYEGEPNAFATGAFRNSALVAVSSGLLGSMSREEVEAVLGHEMAHVANGDMVTLTLIQGVVNTFVVFLSRVVAFFVDRIVFRTQRGTGPGYFITTIVCQLLLGVLASLIVAWFSRQREFRADAGSAQYLGTPQPMIQALARLGGLPAGELPKSLTGFGITDKAGIAALFATHPPIEERIRALQGQRA